MNGLDLLLVSATPIIKIIIYCSVGALLTRNGTIDSHGKRALGNLTKIVFLPSLMFTKLVRSIELSELQHLWVVPATAVLCVFLGLGIGYLVTKVLTPKSYELSRIIMACCAIGNTGNLPLVFVTATCEDVRGPLHSIPDCHNRGVGLVMLGMWIGTMFQWTLGAFLLRHEPTKVSKSKSESQTLEVEMEAKVTDSKSLLGSSAHIKSDETDLAQNLDLSQANLTSKDTELPIAHVDQKPLSKKGCFHNMCFKLKQNMNNPPMLAIFAAFVAICIPPLRKNIISPANALHVPFRCAETMGDAFIPCIMLVLGSNLSNGPAKVDPWIVVIVGFVRLVVLPIITCLIIQYCRTDLGIMPKDQLIGFVAMLIGTAPSAINLSIIATLQNFEPKILSSLLFYQYLASIGTITVCLMFYIHILFPGS